MSKSPSPSQALWKLSELVHLAIVSILPSCCHLVYVWAMYMCVRLRWPIRYLGLLMCPQILAVSAPTKILSPRKDVHGNRKMEKENTRSAQTVRQFWIAFLLPQESICIDDIFHYPHCYHLLQPSPFSIPAHRYLSPATVISYQPASIRVVSGLQVVTFKTWH